MKETRLYDEAVRIEEVVLQAENVSDNHFMVWIADFAL